VRPTFGEGCYATADSAGIPLAGRDGGPLLAHRLIGCVAGRAEHHDRWVTALEQTHVPLSFLRGRLDAVCGTQMAERLTERPPTRRSVRSTTSAAGPCSKRLSGSPGSAGVAPQPPEQGGPPPGAGSPNGVASAPPDG